jgi:hypothetical protein
MRGDEQKKGDGWVAEAVSGEWVTVVVERNIGMSTRRRRGSWGPPANETEKEKEG